MIMKAFVINLDSRPDRLKLFQEQSFPFEVKMFPGIIASCGQDGCSASHLTILKKQKEFPFAIFEDDCKLIQPWSIVEKAMKQLPKDWDALWLGATLKRPLKRYSTNLYRLNKAYTLHAVIYNSKKMVDHIVKKHNVASGVNLDVFYKFFVQPRFKCFITYPMVATQRSDISDIGGEQTINEQYILDKYTYYTNK